MQGTTMQGTTTQASAAPQSTGQHKRRSFRPARIFALLCAMAALLFLCSCSNNSRQLPRVRMVAELMPNGSLRITEEVSYNLGQGVYSISHALEGYRASDITDLSATGRMADGNRVTFAQHDQAALGDSASLVATPTDGTHVLLTLYHPFSAASGVTTLTFRYTLHNMAIRYTDAGTFTWAPLGARGWDVSIDAWSARIVMPMRADAPPEVTLLAAPANAKLDQFSDGFQLSASQVKAGAHASIRVDFEPSILLYVPVTQGQPLDSIRSEDAAEAGRRAALGYGWLGFCALALCAFVLWIRLRVDRDPALLPERMRQGQLLGVTAPAELSTLVQQVGSVGHRDVIAMLLHLIHRNHLALLRPSSGLTLTRDTMDQARIIRLHAPRDTLLDGEFFLIHWFIDSIGDGKSVTLEQIRRVPRDRFFNDYRVWKQLVNEQIAQRPWFRDLRHQRTALLALGALMVVGTPVMLALGALPLAWAGLPLGAAVIAYALLMRRRTPAAAMEAQRWQSLRDQLETGVLHGASTIAQWERILLYAEAMGMGPQAATALQNAVGAEVAGEAPPWPDAHESTFLAWPLLEYAGQLEYWFELFCQAIMPLR